jgi:hypothetical protein
VYTIHPATVNETTEKLSSFYFFLRTQTYANDLLRRLKHLQDFNITISSYIFLDSKQKHPFFLFVLLNDLKFLLQFVFKKMLIIFWSMRFDELIKSRAWAFLQ